jgi:hypothetical protein
VKRFAVLFCVPMIACGGSVVGDWEGECVYSVSGQLSSFDVSLEIADVKKGDINGTGEVVDDGDMRSTGILDGIKKGSQVDVEIQFEDGRNEDSVFVISGEVNGREITGDCSLGGLAGDIELERQE